MDPTQIGQQFTHDPIGTAIGVAIVALIAWITRGRVETRRAARSTPPPPRKEHKP